MLTLRQYSEWIDILSYSSSSSHLVPQPILLVNAMEFTVANHLENNAPINKREPSDISMLFVWSIQPCRILKLTVEMNNLLRLCYTFDNIKGNL